MQVYLVGGAVRDRLLGLPVKERDFVVVGATAEQMLALGYRQVGRDFPVFLHPQTQEEYALARSRRPSTGHQGVQPTPLADPSISLEQDLARRDLTINAMAEAEDGSLIDPFGGYKDLRERILRHVSEAFADDPLRVLRVARFMARYHDLGFRVAPETLRLMHEMGRSGLLDGLVAERVWQELMSALSYADPAPFFLTLRECGVLLWIFPEIDRLWGVPQPAQWHPEIDCGVHTMMVVKLACRLTDSLAVRFAALTHDLGKGETPREILPSHRGHEALGARLLKGFCARLKAPRRFLFLAERCALYHGLCHRIEELRPATILKLFESLQAFHHPRHLEEFLLVCEADYRGRKGCEERAYPQAERVRQLFRAARGISSTDLQTSSAGRAVGLALREARIEAIKQAKYQPVSSQVD